MTATTDERRLTTPPREGVRRTASFRAHAGADPEDDGLTLDGYAAVFNRETVIDSWEGRFRENIAPGAMKKSFRENPPRIQFDHGTHPLIGSIPIGSVTSIREEVDPELAPDGGAHIIARLADNWLIEPVRDAIASGAVDGMSFRFGVIRDEWRTAEGKLIKDDDELAELLFRTWSEDMPDEELPLRTLRELKVPEVGPVVWPAYEETSVGVRSQTLTIDLARLRDRDQRSSLARAVYLTDQADGDAPPLLTHPAQAERAEAHEDEPSDTPRATEPPAGPAESHESASRRHARISFVEYARATLQTIERSRR